MEFSQIQAKLMQKRREKGVLIAAHRGTFGASILQNTKTAYKNALLHGADIIEVDVAKSSDGVLYAHHFGTEKQVFGKDIDIRTMPAHEIDKLVSINALGIPVDHSLCRLDDILEEFKGKCFINIDHAWFNWETVIRALQRHNMQDQIILKSHVDDQLSASYKKLGGDMMYMPILKNGADYINEFKRVEAFELPIVAAEVLMTDQTAVDHAPELIRYLHRGGYLAWVNTLTMSDKIPQAVLEQFPENVRSSPEIKGMLDMLREGKKASFCYGFDDNTAIEQGAEAAYGKLIDMGYDVLQTDWPALVRQYLLERSCQNHILP